MSAPARSKRKLLGYTLLGLGAWGLIFAWHFAPPGGKASPDSSPPDQPQAGVSSSSGGLETPLVRVETSPSSPATGRPDSDAARTTEEAGAQPASRLQEAELEHLNEVFLNTLRPLFQYDFPLDQEGRSAIDVFVASMPEGLTSDDLETISAMIESRLSAPEAEDLAFIITHLYRLQQEEARLMSEGEPITTLAQQLKAQAQLSQLREEWFGPELSTMLFSDTGDAGATAVQSPLAGPTGGSDPENLGRAPTEEQAELAAMESAWQQRYQNFLMEKQIIDRAGLDQAEKDRQIELLLQQHYTPQEVEAAKAFDQSQK